MSESFSWFMAILKNNITEFDGLVKLGAAPDLDTIHFLTPHMNLCLVVAQYIQHDE